MDDKILDQIFHAYKKQVNRERPDCDEDGILAEQDALTAEYRLTAYDPPHPVKKRRNRRITPDSDGASAFFREVTPDIRSNQRTD